MTDCSIQTLEADETLDFDFTSANVVNKLIMLSECLKEAFAELDMSSDVLEILLSPSPPYFRLSTFGDAGTTQVCLHFIHVPCNVPITITVRWGGVYVCNAKTF